MLDKLLEQTKNQEITIVQWMMGFIGIVFIRFIFESLSSPTSSGLIPSDAYTLIHYGLFWITLVLGLIIVVGFFSKDYLLTSKIALFGLPVIWLAPIFDIIISRGGGFVQSYIFDSHGKLLFDFITFFGPSLTRGATYGMRIEMIFVLAGVGWYLWKISKNIYRSVVGVFFVYTLGFVVGALPGIMYTLSHVSTPDTLFEILNYFRNLVVESTISHNTLREGMLSVSPERFFELGFDKLFSQILFIISFFLGGWLFWKINSKKFWAVVKNCRPERVGSYLALLLCGVGFAYINRFGNPFLWVDLLGIICLLISWVGLWMYAVHNNDIADIGIDKISNTERPLIKKELDREDMLETGYVWLAVALLGAWNAGFYPFFMSLVYISASHIYSSPPLRLRRFPVISSFLIGVASLATILAGFFFVSFDKQIQTFPIFLSVGIVIMATLAINIKDMKDIEGDRVNGIVTLPVLFRENGPKIVGLCFGLSFLLVPIFLSFYLLYIFALPASIIGYRLVVKKPYREKPTFVLRFVFLACVGISYLGIFWFGHLYGLI